MSAGSLAAERLSEADAITRALAQPELIALGEANRAEAQARIAGIRRFDNPEVSISREGVSGGGASETEYEAGIVQPFDLSGQRTRLRDAARAEARAVDADTARRQQERVAEVRRAYAGCAAAREKVPVAESFVARLREAERIVAARTRAGDTAGYDLRRLRVEARSAEARSRLIAGDVAAECTALSRLTGDPDARPSSPLSEIARRPVSPATTSGTRADLLARQARLEAATLGVRAAERARIPEFAVGLGYKRITSAGESASGPVVSLGARVPLFNRGGAAISEARARQRAREAELGLAQREIEAAVAVAKARVDAALQALQSATQALDDARRLGPIAEAAYQGGEGGVTELVDAYRAAQEAEIEVIDLLERAALARVDAELSIGSVS
jgi:cobalt-zinc-cadmium efflux system outer membrane protein